MHVVLQGTQSDGKIVALRADRNDLSFVEHDHEKIHEGDRYILSHYFSSIDTDGYGRIRIKTPPDKYVHTVVFTDAALGVLRTIYKNPGFTHFAANALTEHNRNDNYVSSKPSILAQACHTPGGAGAGTVWIPTRVFGSATTPVNTSPANNRAAEEVVLAPNTNYLFEVQSLGDGNKVTLGIDYYWESV